MQLIFLCPLIKKAIGGVKVIYRLAELILQLGRTGSFSASVMQPNTGFFRVVWVDSQVLLKRAFFKHRWMGKPSFSGVAGVFDARRHMVVMPELWARKYAPQLADMGVRYALFVQNGYFITNGQADDLDRAYPSVQCKVKAIGRAEKFELPLSTTRSLADTHSEAQQRKDRLIFLNAMGLNTNGLPI